MKPGFQCVLVRCTPGFMPFRRRRVAAGSPPPARPPARPDGDGVRGRLKDTADLDSVQGDLVGVVTTALEPAHVSVWMSKPR
jgi:hypothetical protein